MKLSTRTRYGLRALVDLAARHAQGPVMLRIISESQGLSKKYLDNIFTALRLAGLVRTVRGARGGYLLARDPADISVAEVVEALEGDLNPVDCVEYPQTCDRALECVTRELWTELRDAMVQVLESKTLEDLVIRRAELAEKGTKQKSKSESKRQATKRRSRK